MNKTNKKGSSEIWWIIAAAVIAFLVVIFVLIWFKGSGEKIFGNVNTKIGELDKPLDLPAFGACSCDSKLRAGTPDCKACGGS